MAPPTETVMRHPPPHGLKLECGYLKAFLIQRRSIFVYLKKQTKKTELHNAHQLFLLTKSMKDKQKMIIVILITIVTNINWDNMQ